MISLIADDFNRKLHSDVRCVKQYQSFYQAEKALMKLKDEYDEDKYNYDSYISLILDDGIEVKLLGIHYWGDE